MQLCLQHLRKPLYHFNFIIKHKPPLNYIQSQPFRKLSSHIIYGNIKTRYNVFRKCANDVFGEYDFMVQKLPKSYIMRLLEKSPALKLSQSVYCTEMMGLILLARSSICTLLDAWRFAHCCDLHNAHGAIFLGSLASELADSLCVDYLAQVTAPWLVLP